MSPPEYSQSLKKVRLYSNHFALELNKDILFNEWFMRFISKEDVEKYQENLSEAEEAVPHDSRVLINEIYFTNKKSIT